MLIPLPIVKSANSISRILMIYRKITEPFFCEIIAEISLLILLMLATHLGGVETGRGCADALSGSSGSSVVLLKYTLILVEVTTIFLTTDFTDFTDFCYASVWYLRVSRLQLNQENQ